MYKKPPTRAASVLYPLACSLAGRGGGVPRWRARNKHIERRVSMAPPKLTFGTHRILALLSKTRAGVSEGHTGPLLRLAVRSGHQHQRCDFRRFGSIRFGSECLSAGSTHPHHPKVRLTSKVCMYGRRWCSRVLTHILPSNPHSFQRLNGSEACACDGLRETCVCSGIHEGMTLADCDDLQCQRFRRQSFPRGQNVTNTRDIA